MYDPEHARPAWAQKMTRVGQFLRYTRIEDLPQLINVLRGEMTLNEARSAAEELSAGRDAELKRVWSQYDRAVILAQLYAGDRDANLSEAIELGSRAVNESRQDFDKRRGTIVLALNMIGRAYLNLAIGDRWENLRHADDALRQGLEINQQPNEYPEFRDMLLGALKLVEVSKQHHGDLPDGEIHQRAQAELDKLIRNGNGVERAAAMIRFTWSHTDYGQLSPSLSDYHYFMDKALMLAGDYRGSITHFRMSLAINSQRQSRQPWFSGFDRMVSQEFRSVSVASGATESEIAQDTIAARNGFVEAKELFEPLGDQHAAASNFRDAYEEYREALKISPFHVDLLVKRATISARAGDTDRALPDFNDALRLYPDNPDALWNRAILRMQAQQWVDALEDLKHVVASTDTSRRPAELRILLAEARCFEEIGNNDAAGARLDKALPAVSDNDVRAAIQNKITRLRAPAQ